MEHAATDAVEARIQPRHVISAFASVLWQLRGMLFILFGLFGLLSIAMHYVGGAVVTATGAPAAPGEVVYFCAVTALTIGYGDVVPTTALGRVDAVLLGMVGLLITGLVTAAAVHGVQAAARRARVLPR